MRGLWAGVVAAMGVLGTGAEPFRIESGKQSPQLVELYTSQGCSSCPPAENWLGRWVDDPGLWRNVVPIAFHVDYWDRLGWKDRFASRENTLRQYRLRDEGAVASIYTPGFVVDGKEWRGWFQGEALRPGKRAQAQGSLSIEIESGSLTAEYADLAEGAILNVAILGVGLEMDVSRGENKGRRLSHDFVALEHVEWPLNGESLQMDLPDVDADGLERLALAAWVTKAGGSRPTLVIGSWIDSKYLDTESN